MSERVRATDPDMTILDWDHDFSYFTHVEDESKVRRLAAGISERGIVATIARPFRLRKLGRLTGIDINIVDSFEGDYAEIVRPLTTKELAHNISLTERTEG